MKDDDIQIAGFYNWMKPSATAIYSILTAGILTRGEIYQCLTPDVKSINDLKNKLYATYPDKKSRIERYF